MTINAANRSVAIHAGVDGVRRSKYPAGSLPAFFTDGFETGDKTHTENGASWLGINEGAGDDVSVVASRGNPGYALQFTFAGNADPADVALAEQRFDLGANYSELTITFDLYIPDGTEGWGSAAYAHRDSTSSDNNKLFRLWPTTGESATGEVGASLLLNTTPDGYSAVRSEWNTLDDGGGMTARGQSKVSFIEAGDLGTWIEVKLYCKAATATTNGTLRIYKNGALKIDNTETVNQYDPVDPHAWRYGYLLGSADSGFDSTTMLQIDNIRFYAGLA